MLELCNARGAIFTGLFQLPVFTSHTACEDDAACPASVASLVAWSVVSSPVWVSPSAGVFSSSFLCCLRGCGVGASRCDQDHFPALLAHSGKFLTTNVRLAASICEYMRSFSTQHAFPQKSSLQSWSHFVLQCPRDHGGTLCTGDRL